jgi:hypothetical protein
VRIRRIGRNPDAFDWRPEVPFGVVTAPVRRRGVIMSFMAAYKESSDALMWKVWLTVAVLQALGLWGTHVNGSTLQRVGAAGMFIAVVGWAFLSGQHFERSRLEAKAVTPPEPRPDVPSRADLLPPGR